MDGGIRTAITVTGTATAKTTWTFDNLMRGQGAATEDYDVYISWTADATNGAADAALAVFEGTTSMWTGTVDQSAAPTQLTTFLPFSDSQFEKLTTITLDSDDARKIVVELANNSATAGKTIQADAVYLVRSTAMSQSTYDDDGRLISTENALGATTTFSYDTRGRRYQVTSPDPDGAGSLAAPVAYTHYNVAGQATGSIAPDLRVNTNLYDGRGRTTATYAGSLVDNTSADYAATGTWADDSANGLFGASRTAASATTSTATATFTFENLIVGDDYDVYITWAADATNGADDTPVAIYQKSTSETADYTGTLDQTVDPTQPSNFIPFSDQLFEKLDATITLTDSTLIVKLTNGTGETGETIAADAVYVVRSDPMSQTVHNAAGQLMSSIDALGNATTYTYDNLGRSIAVTTPDPDGAGTDYTSLLSRTYYNDDAQFGASISPDGRVDTPAYDQLGRRTASYVGQVITPDIGAYAEPSGTWSDATGGPFDGGYRTVSSVTGSATAKTTWTFDDLISSEEYEVYVTWTSDAANTTDAHFSVYSGSTSGTLLTESDLDQTADPSPSTGFRGFSDQPFELLATVTPGASDPTTLVVQLSNEGATASKTVVADSVYVVRTSPTSQSVFDFAGRLDASIGAAGNQTDYVYDNLGRQTSITDPESGETEYTYDVAGRMASLTDPVNNTTSWTYDSFGRKAVETINVDSTDLTRTFEYNAAGAVVQQIDRNGRVTDFTYDAQLRRATEKWYDDVNDTTANFTYTTTYNQAGRIASIDDGDLVFDYTYTILGNLATLTRDLDHLTGDIEFTYSHDALGRTTGITTKLGSTKDYANAYSYDALGRLTQVTQSGQTGGNTVAEKRVDFDYTVDGRLSKTTRYADLAGTENVVETDHVFDILGRVANITHQSGSSVWADYDYSWDAAGRLTELIFDFDGTSNDDDASYTYDDTSQLTAADYTTQSDETYTYDANGNRTLTGYTTGDHNRLTSDGTYYYTYDNQGNQTGKYSDSGHTTPVEKRFWDHRNRLVKVDLYVSGSLSKTVEYAYDHINRMYSRVVAADSTRTIFVHDERNQIVLDLTDDNSGNVQSTDLARRRLWNPAAVDQALAEEHISSGDVYYPLVDHLNTTRDVAEYNSTTDTTTISKHVTYDAYGQVLSDTAPSLILLPGYTGKYNDPLTGDNYHINRWYDLSTGRWRSEDPIGFGGQDENLYRYVRNRVAHSVDSDGRVTWVNAASTNWIYSTDIVLVRAGPGNPEDIRKVMGPKQLGSTRPRMDIEFEAMCYWKMALTGLAVPGFGGWQLSPEGITVNFSLDVYIRPGLPQEMEDWTVRAESDHIGDFQAWAAGPGKDVADEVEAELMEVGFWTAEGLATYVSMEFFLAVGDSAADEIEASDERWDEPGHHTWGGENARL